MSATAEHFASIDTQLASARAAWQTEKDDLTAHIAKLEIELALCKDFLDKANESKDEAMRTTVKLLTQFGIVATVFDEAKQVAMEAGLYSKSDTQTLSTETQKELIDKMTGAESATPPTLTS